MKRSIKFICAAFVTVILIMSFSACSNNDVPDGYQLIACEGDEFRLYVPTQWIANTTGGVTSAFYTSDATISVSAYKASDAKGLTLEEYWKLCNENYAKELESYVYDGSQEPEPKNIGGKAGLIYLFDAKVTKFDEYQNKYQTTDYKFLQAMAQNDGEIFVIMYSAPAEIFDSLLETVKGNAQNEGIIPYFTFAKPYVSEDNDKKFNDKVAAPDGMKLASTDERPYRFFVPEAWVINNRTDATAAYVSDTDKSNVSVQMYMTSSNTETGSEHWKRLEESYKNTFSSYTLDSDTEIKMDGVSAHKYVYSVVSGGQEYKIVQAIVKKGSMFYYVTYTATPENFDKHLPDVDKMIESFDIR